MTRRLQVLMGDDELRSIQRLARAERMTTAAWVRARLREASAQRSAPDPSARLAAIRQASRHRFPVPAIDDLLAEIEAGHLDEHSGGS
jgi:hypothetical protein